MGVTCSVNIAVSSSRKESKNTYDKEKVVEQNEDVDLENVEQKSDINNKKEACEDEVVVQKSDHKNDQKDQTNDFDTQSKRFKDEVVEQNEDTDIKQVEQNNDFDNQNMTYKDEVVEQTQANKNNVVEQKQAYEDEVVQQTQADQDKVVDQKQAYKEEVVDQKQAFKDELVDQKQAYKDEVEEQQQAYKEEVEEQQQAYKEEVVEQQQAYKYEIEEEQQAFKDEVVEQNEKYDIENVEQKNDAYSQNKTYGDVVLEQNEDYDNENEEPKKSDVHETVGEMEEFITLEGIFNSDDEMTDTDSDESEEETDDEGAVNVSKEELMESVREAIQEIKAFVSIFDEEGNIHEEIYNAMIKLMSLLSLPDKVQSAKKKKDRFTSSVADLLVKENIVEVMCSIVHLINAKYYLDQIVESSHRGIFWITIVGLETFCRFSEQFCIAVCANAMFLETIKEIFEDNKDLEFLNTDQTLENDEETNEDNVEEILDDRKDLGILKMDNNLDNDANMNEDNVEETLGDNNDLEFQTTDQTLENDEETNEDNVANWVSHVIDIILSSLRFIIMRESCVSDIRSLEIVSELEPYLKLPWKRWKLLIKAILAVLTDGKENETIHVNKTIVKYLKKQFSRCLGRKTHGSRGWSCKELTIIIQLLARNNTNKKRLVKNGCVELLVRLGQVGNTEDEKLESVKAIWSLAFHEDNRKPMVSNEELGVIELLLDLKESSNTEITKTCEGALWTLRTELHDSEKYKEFAPVTIEATDDAEGKQDDGHIMMSYQSENRELVKNIRDRLRAAHHKVWMDIDEMGGESTIESMGNAVDNAKIVMLCITQKYQQSPNCRLEAEYAFKEKKSIIFLKLERGFEAKSWLGIICGNHYFHEFTDKYPFETKMAEVLRVLAGVLGKKQKGMKLQRRNTMIVARNETKS